jgi:hypothetical protein
VDVTYAALATDAELVALALAEDRALLTRDRRLLMHAAVRTGYYPRSQMAEEQTREVLQRFELRARVAPFTRCLHCNGLLASVSKDEVWEKLEPLTKIYYRNFRHCLACRRIYWEGSHSTRLRQLVEQLLE